MCGARVGFDMSLDLGPLVGPPRHACERCSSTLNLDTSEVRGATEETFLLVGIPNRRRQRRAEIDLHESGGISACWITTIAHLCAELGIAWLAVRFLTPFGRAAPRQHETVAPRTSPPRRTEPHANIANRDDRIAPGSSGFRAALHVVQASRRVSASRCNRAEFTLRGPLR